MDTKEWSTPKVSKNTKILNQEHWDSLSAPRQGCDRTKEIARSEKDKRRRLNPKSPKRKGSRCEGWEEDHDAGGEPEEKATPRKGKARAAPPRQAREPKGSRPPRASRRPYPRRLPSSTTTTGKNLQVGGKRKTRNPHIPIQRKKHPSLPLSLSGQGETKIRRQAKSPKRRDLPAEREHKLHSQTNVARPKDDPEKNWHVPQATLAKTIRTPRREK